MKTLKEDPLTIINGSLFPNEEHIYLRSITTLNLEHMFSLLNHKHGSNHLQIHQNIATN